MTVTKTDSRPVEIHDVLSRQKSRARALNDLTEGFLAYRLWVSLAWYDIRQRYHRSFIGPFWITISMGVMIAALGLLYSRLFGMSLEQYLPFLSLGFIVWNVVNGTINESARAFIDASTLIKQTDMNYSVHIWRIAARNVIIFFHNIFVFFLVVVLFNSPVNANWLFALPGLALTTLIAAGAGFAIAVLSARFRDIPNVIANIMQVGFFLTPIIWDVSLLPDRFVFLDINPFYYMVEFIRQPLLGNVPSINFWLVGLLMLTVSWTLAVALFFVLRRRIAYWV